MKFGQPKLLEDGFLNIKIDPGLDLVNEIGKLKKEKNAIILAHYYQEDIIQDVADFVDDSLGLSQQAEKTNKDMIVFAGVHFMAETAKILNPEKKVVLPDTNAGCSLEESCQPEDFKRFIDQHPDHMVVTYINCSAEVKALSDIICTSSNAVKIIQSIPKDKPIIFAPDKNLGNYLIKETGRDMLLWDGVCVVHEAFAIEELLQVYREHPKAQIIAHPESREHILKVAQFIGSTTALLKHVMEDPCKEFIVATEAGILHQMHKEVPGKTFIPAPVGGGDSCACSECAFMKLNTLEKLYLCMKYEQPEIILSNDLIQKAYLPIKRMLTISAAAGSWVRRP